MSVKLELTAFKEMSEFLDIQVADQQLSIVCPKIPLSKEQTVPRAGPGSPSVPGRLLHVSWSHLCSNESEQKGKDFET